MALPETESLGGGHSPCRHGRGQSNTFVCDVKAKATPDNDAGLTANDAGSGWFSHFKNLSARRGSAGDAGWAKPSLLALSYVYVCLDTHVLTTA